jgi:type IV pilus assembly protein PilB
VTHALDDDGHGLMTGLDVPDALEGLADLLADEGSGWPGATRSRLGDVLLDAGIVTEPELHQALEAQRAVVGVRRRLGHVLVDLGIATERQIADALAAQLHLEVVDLTKIAVSPDTVRLLPRGVAARLGMIVIAKDGRRLTLAVSDPTDVVALDDVRLHTGATELVVRVATETQVRAHLTRTWSLAEDSSDVSTFFDDAARAHEEEVLVARNDAPTVRLVTIVLADAVRVGASDIHVEPQRDELRIRYRVDGVLREVMTVPRGAHASIVSRFKIISGLDIAERRLPQDGRTRINVDGRAIDARVSTLPSVHGEKVVIRLLTQADRLQPLAETGLDAEQLVEVRRALDSPQGLVLITGPTGSGKTSTLYSALQELRTSELNIVTLEDPVELQVPGVTQVQVHERSGLTFSRGLRAVLRQDPDVVLVGEVRDLETAELAMRASLTGHLVLTTLHTNGALASVARLVDMGLESYVVGSALTAVVAQRLVRRPCPSCAVPHEPDPAMLRALGVDPRLLEDATPVLGAGCAECGGTGYRGRTGVFEMIVVDQALRHVLLSDPSERAIGAATAGMPTLQDAAVAKALDGLTTFEEVVRVSPRV